MELDDPTGPLDWTRPEGALAMAVEVLRVPLPQLLPRASQVLTDLAPHVALAQLSGVCAYSPMRAVNAGAGTDGPAERITSAELGRLAGLVPVGRPWQGEAVLAGASRPALAVSSVTDADRGAMLVLLRSDDEQLGEDELTVLQRIWDLVTLNGSRRTADAEGGHAAKSARRPTPGPGPSPN